MGNKVNSTSYDRSIETENCPPIRPNTKSRKRCIPSPSAFTAIDGHALKAPASAAQSIHGLSTYLIQPARSDIEKVRVFYRWITDNISYDVASMARGTTETQKAESVLQRRKAVCEGYANLLLELCREAKIPCRKVYGFSKGYGYNPDTDFTPSSRTDHAWNLVYVGGHWWPMEATWGAGTVSGQRVFQKGFQELYFLTDPKEFAVKHFPCEDNDVAKSQPLQLLRRPLGLEEFNKRADIDTDGLNYGYKSLSHRNHKIELDNECTLTFRTRKVDMEDVSCILKSKTSSIPSRKYVLVRRTGSGRFSVKVSPPRTGSYELELYGKPRDSNSESLARMVLYSLSVKSAICDNPYPEHTGLWGFKGVDYKKYGFKSDIKSKDVIETNNGKLDFSLKVRQGAKIMYDIKDKQDNDIKRYTSGFLQKGRLVIQGNIPNKGHYVLRVFGNCGTGTTFDHVADFLVSCNTPYPNPPTYPVSKTLWSAQEDAVTKYGFTNKILSMNKFSTTSGHVQIRIPTTRPVVTSVKLESPRQELTDYTISFFADKMLTIMARMPQKDNYRLTLFSDQNNNHDSSQLDFVAEFLVENKSESTDMKPFPKKFRASETYGCTLLEPLHKELPANQNVKLKLRSKLLKNLLVERERYKKSGDVFEISFTTPRFGSVTVSGNTAGDQFDGLYQFTVR